MPDDLREHDVRAFLERMAAEMPTPLEIPAAATRRARATLARTTVIAIVAAALGLAGAIGVLRTLLLAEPQPADEDRSDARIQTISLPGDPMHVGVGEGFVWVAGTKVVKVDPATNRVVATYPGKSRSEGSAIAVGEGAAWVSGGAFDGEVLRIDATSDEVLTIHAGSGYNDPYAVAVGAGSVWVTNDFDALNSVEGTLRRIDPATEEDAVAATIPLSSPRGVTVLDGTVWVVVTNESGVSGQLIGVDAASGRIVSTYNEEIDGEIVAGFGSLWAFASPSETTDRFLRLDPATGEVVASVPLPDRGPGLPRGRLELAIGEGAVWIALTDRNETGVGTIRVVKVDPATNTIVGDVAFPGQATSIAVGEGAVWVTDGISALHRIELDNFVPGEGVSA